MKQKYKQINNNKKLWLSLDAHLDHQTGIANVKLN